MDLDKSIRDELIRFIMIENCLQVSLSLFFFVVITISPIVVWGDILTLRSSKEVVGNLLEMKDGQLLLTNGRIFDKNDVRQIVFKLDKVENEFKNTIVTPEIKEHAEKLFQEAAAFGKKHPESDALILLDRTEYQLRPNGTWINRQHYCVQILNDSARKRWKTLSQSFQDGQSTARIIKASTYLPDGTIFPVVKENITVNRPKTEDSKFHDYMAISYDLPHVEAGAVIEIEVELETYNPFKKNFFFPVSLLQDFHPIKSTVFRVSIPESKQLFYHANNFPSEFSQFKEPEIRVLNGQKEYTWEMKNVPGITVEPYMPRLTDIAPYVRTALFKDWDTVFEWFATMYKQRSIARSGLKRFTLDLVKNCTSEEGKIAIIYHYLQKKLRYLSVNPGISASYGGLDANLTWKMGYGDCLDKALLFTAMLDVVNIKSTPVILNTNNDDYAYGFDIPHIDFTHAITMITLKSERTENPSTGDRSSCPDRNRRIFLDSSAGRYRYPYLPELDQGVKGLNIFDKKIETIPVSPPADNRTNQFFSITVHPSGNASVDFSFVPTGPPEANLRAGGDYRPVEQKRIFQEYANRLSSGGELIEYKLFHSEDLSKPCRLALKYELKNYPIQAGDIMMMSLPGQMYSSSLIVSEKRAHPIDYTTYNQQIRTYRIQLPDNFEVVYLPESVDFKSRHGTFKAVTEKREDLILIDSSFVRFNRFIPAEDYAGYKTFMESIMSYMAEPVILQPVSKSGRHVSTTSRKLVQ